MSPREKMFPPKPDDESRDDTRKPYERLSDLAQKVLRVPKAEIDKREKEWQRKQSR